MKSLKHSSDYEFSTIYNQFITKNILPPVDWLLDTIGRYLKYLEKNTEDAEKSRHARCEIAGCKKLLDYHNKLKLYEND